MHVRPLTEADETSWFRLMREGAEINPTAFLLSHAEISSMTPERVRATLAKGNVYGVVSGADEMLGFAALHMWALDRIAHRADIGPFYITPDARGSGAADALMEALALGAQAAQVTWLDLWVDESNARAQRFYARHCFERIGRREDAVRVGDLSGTDVLMTRRLEPAAATD